MSDLGPMPDPKIEPGEPNPGGPDALQEDPESLGAIPDLTPEENPALEEKAPEPLKEEVSDSEDTSTKATRGESGHDADDEPEKESPA
jgi:hypothetical protein